MIGVQIKILLGFGLSKTQLRGTYPPPTHPQSHGSGFILHCWLSDEAGDRAGLTGGERDARAAGGAL